MAQLWEMYELERSGRFTDVSDAAEKNYKLSVRNKELEQEIENLQSELTMFCLSEHILFLEKSFLPEAPWGL